MYAQKKPIENTHIVREKDRERFRELFAAVLLAAPLGTFLLLFTFQNVEVIRLGREATRLQESREALVEQQKNLRLELERLQSLGGVERSATALGFESTPADRIVTVTDVPPTAQRVVPERSH